MAKFVTLKNYGADLHGAAGVSSYRISIPYLNRLSHRNPEKLVISATTIERKLKGELRFFGMKNEYSDSARGAFSFDVEDFTLLNQALKSANMITSSLEYMPGGNYGKRLSGGVSVTNKNLEETAFEVGDYLELGYQKSSVLQGERWYIGRLEESNATSLLLKFHSGYRRFLRAKINWIMLPETQPLAGELLHQVELTATLKRRGGHYPSLRLEVLGYE